MGVGIGCLGMIIFGFVLFSALGSDESSGMLWFALIGIGVSAFGGLLIDFFRKSNFADELMVKLKEALGQIENFKSTQEFISSDRETMIAIDEESKKVCILWNKHDNVTELSSTFGKYDYEYQIYDFRDILQTEILENGSTVTKTSRRSQVGGALLGSMLAGGAGAVIGGLSGATKSQNEVKKVQLQIIVNDTKKPFHRITFMSEEKAVSKENMIYKHANKLITHWQSILSHIINKTDAVDIPDLNNNKNGQQLLNSTSVAEELTKLAELRDKGIISEDEFVSQKKKLLI